MSAGGAAEKCECAGLTDSHFSSLRDEKCSFLCIFSSLAALAPRSARRSLLEVRSRSVQNAKPGKSQKNNELRRGSKILVGSGMAKKPISTGPQRAFPVEICEQTPFLTHLHLFE